MIETDEALVGRSQERDRSAFEELVRRHARAVFSRIYLETGDTHLAEDLVQETFLTAWKSIHQVTEPGGFRAWLFAVARTVVLDASRRDRRKKRFAGRINGANTFPRLAPDPQPGPAESAEAQEERQRVLGLLRSLPQEYREPLTLRFIAGADYETIGQQLGLTNGSLRGLLHRGMARLRAELTRLGP